MCLRSRSSFTVLMHNSRLTCAVPAPVCNRLTAFSLRSIRASRQSELSMCSQSASHMLEARLLVLNDNDTAPMENLDRRWIGATKSYIFSATLDAASTRGTDGRRRVIADVLQKSEFLDARDIIYLMTRACRDGHDAGKHFLAVCHM